jgi:hypothetical protein
VIQAFADAHPEGAAEGVLEALADGFLRSSCVAIAPPRLEGGRGHQEARYSVPDMLRAEARLLDVALGADPRGGLVADAGAVEGAIARRPTLGADQAAAVRHLCSGNARVRVLEARAGTGKTFTLEAVREAYEASGAPVLGIAWQGQAADVLQRDAGIASQTAALLLQRLERDERAIPAGSVIVCDEASMMPTRALERLAAEAGRRCCRLLLVGDRAQLPAIDAAGGFAAIADRLGGTELAENRRQRTAVQRLVADRLAAGRPDEALALLGEHGRLCGFDDAREARAALVAAWAQTSLADPASALILAHDRHEVATLNRMAREALDRAGLLGPSRLVVSGREWAAGDRLVCRRNDYRLGVRNGTRATVVAVDRASRTLRAVTDDGLPVALPEHYLAHAHHGYAITGHTSQGATVERTYLLASPERGGAEWAYVASTRQRVDLCVFAVHDDPERLADALARAWSRSGAKHLALDLAAADARAGAIRDARGELEGVLPEQLAERARALRAARSRAREESRAATGEGARRAGREAQRLGEELRSVEGSLGGWAAASAIARPSAAVLNILGPRPARADERTVWDRAVGAAATYRHRKDDAGEPGLLGPRPAGASERGEWDHIAEVVRDCLGRLGRIDAAPREIVREDRGRSRLG